MYKQKMIKYYFIFSEEKTLYLKIRIQNSIYFLSDHFLNTYLFF